MSKRKSLNEFQETEVEKYEQMNDIYRYITRLYNKFSSKLSKLYPWNPRQCSVNI